LVEPPGSEADPAKGVDDDSETLRQVLTVQPINRIITRIKVMVIGRRLKRFMTREDN